MASVALDGTRFGTADGLTRPGTWPVSRRYDPAFRYYFDHFIFRQRDRAITPSFARP